MSYHGRRRRTQNVINPKLRPIRGLNRPQIEDTLPFDCPNIDSISPDIKHFINELERQYIERYNILISNRIIYEEIIQNVSTHLDSKGISPQILTNNYQNVVIKESQHEDSNQL